MPRKTFFVVQPFERRGRSVRAGVPVEARTAADADRIAKRLSLIKLGAVAFSREVDPDSDDAEDPVLIASYGEVPEGVLELGQMPRRAVGE